jgi:Rrf2 family nitric oxide-sensitive transcriptional repressor
MFSQTVEYALRAVVYLAGKSPSPAICEEIAAATKVPRPYMAKVLLGLVRSKVLHSQRGLGGGVSLQRNPKEVTILEVVNAVDPIIRITKCPLDLASHGFNLCPLHRRMDDALAKIEETFQKTTLDEVLARPGESIPLCDFPSVEKRQPLALVSTETKKKRAKS